MAEFGKLKFSVSFDPTSAFPLDARCYFTSLEKAQAAAKTAEEVGSTNTVYYIGMKLLVVEEATATWYTIQPDKTLKPESTESASNYEIGEGLNLDGDTLSVETTTTIEPNNDLPVSSSAIHAELEPIAETIAELSQRQTVEISKATDTEEEIYYIEFI